MSLTSGHYSKWDLEVEYMQPHLASLFREVWFARSSRVLKFWVRVLQSNVIAKQGISIEFYHCSQVKTKEQFRAIYFGNVTRLLWYTVAIAHQSSLALERHFSNCLAYYHN